MDGSIYTQPLYVPGVSINSGTYNVLYVGTENDSVYALNADVPGSVLWKRSFLTSTATIGHGYTGGRTSIGGNVGITGTPVIDPVTNWMYVVVRTTEGGNQVSACMRSTSRLGLTYCRRADQPGGKWNRNGQQRRRAVCPSCR